MKMPQWMSVVAFALILYAAWLVYGCEQQRQGELKQRIKAREQVIAALAQRHKVDTLRLVRTRHITDSIIDTDTVFYRDTVVKLLQAERHACDTLIGTCEQEKQQLRLQIEDLKKRHPSRFGCAGPLAVTRKGFDLGVSCGLKF